MSFSARDVASRLTRLADSLGTLKSRVREAVAGETSRAVGEAVRDLLAAALIDRQALPRPSYHASPSGRTDDRDPWRDEDDDHYMPASAGYRVSGEDDRSPSASKSKRASRWSAALVFGAATVRCWATRRLPAWLAVGIGLAAGTAVWLGGAVSRAGLALMAAVADLLPAAEPTSTWIIDPP